MANPIDSFSNLPKPVMAITMLASGAGLMTIFMAIQSNNDAWRIAAALIIGVGVIMILFKVVLMLWDKRKSGPFSNLIARAASGRGTMDPAQKARMDDLRKKFEEGVEKFKSAGKDLYALPWYLIVGTPGSGKTEMVRHSNVGFPAGLQDVQQGAGGTMNMNWWFTNHSVMLDTAGRMFMEESEGGNTEWKEFLKLLHVSRPNCPINGLLLVIPIESLLKDSEEKITKYAGVIARQLDVIQRTLEVRFPVTVMVTKADKITGFREFFESVTDPVLQHQILGWSNPASLDDAFKPEEVSKHLDCVREKLTKRRAGLMQNPVHTTDPNGRRVDEVDEMFELPGNLTRIAPRLRLYLEKIFSAGEWSPKPLFLRGIYFTSSMREGQALDMALAQALGVDAESLSGGKEYNPEKAYFLKDVFLGKVFKERGLVTRASHVGKAVARQRQLLVGISLVGALLVGGATLASIFGYKRSFAEPSATWKAVAGAMQANQNANVKAGEARPLSIFAMSDGKLVYNGREKPGFSDVPGGVNVRSDLLAVSGDNTVEIADPLVAKPVLWMLNLRGKDFAEKQVDAHRAVVEQLVLKPLVDTVRLKLRSETAWGAPAVAAVAQLVRLTTLSEGKQPLEQAMVTGQSLDWQLLDVEVLSRYALEDSFADAFPNGASDVELIKLKKAVSRAYPSGYPGAGDPTKGGGSESLFNNDRAQALNDLTKTLTGMATAIATQAPSEDSRIGQFRTLVKLLNEFDKTEASYQDALAWLVTESANSPTESTAKGSVKGYNDFAQAYRTKTDAVENAKNGIAGLTGKYYKDEELSDPVKLLDAVQKQRTEEIEGMIKTLTGQLPDKSQSATFTERLASLSGLFDESKETSVSQMLRSSLKSQIAQLGESLRPVSALLAPGTVQGAPMRLYQNLADTHKFGVEVLTNAEKAPKGDPNVSALFIAQRKALAASAKEQADKLDKRMAWNTSSVDGTARLQRTVSAARRIVTIGQMRGVYGLADAAIAESLWDDGKSLAGVIGSLSDEFLTATDDPDKPARRILSRSPKITMSALAEGVMYDKKYLPEGAIKLVGAWSEIRKIADAKSTGDIASIAREELAAKITRGGRGDDAVAEYAKLYATYWRNLACEQAMPGNLNWTEFKAGVQEASQNSGDLQESLGTLRDRAVGAIDAMTGALGESKTLADAKKTITADYSGLTTFKSFENTLVKWATLTSRDSTDAARDIRRSITKGGGDFSRNYAANFGGQGENANYLKYRDQFILRGLAAIAGATGGDVERAWQELSSTKGVPLAAGQGTTGDLTNDQMISLRSSVEKLGKPGAKGEKTDIGNEIQDPSLLEAVRGLMGEDHLGSDDRQEWFRKIDGLLQSFNKPTKLTLSFTMDNEPPASGAESRAGDTYTRAGFRLNNQLQITDGIKLSNIGTGGKSTRLVMDVPDGGNAEILLFLKDPLSDDGLSNPDLTIPLSTGRWGPMRAFLAEPSRVSKIGSDGKSYRFRILTPDGKHYLWIDMTIETADGAPRLPDISDWPRADRWPPK